MISFLHTGQAKSAKPIVCNLSSVFDIHPVIFIYIFIHIYIYIYNIYIYVYI